MKKVLNNLYIHQDTCNVYIIDDPDGIIVIHSGNGYVLKEIQKKFSKKKILAVLNTHHFRPVVQGLPIFEEHNIDIWIPYWEQVGLSTLFRTFFSRTLNIYIQQVLDNLMSHEFCGYYTS